MRNNNILFSIVIPTYNRATLLKRCLESVETQTYSNWEAIVVDNFSEDNTEEVVQSFEDSRIRYVKNHNYGVIAVSRNKALDMAVGDWICFLDSDDCWYPNKLERMLDFTEDYDLIYHGYRKNIKRTKLLQRMNVYFYKIKEPTVAYVLQRGDPVNPSCACVSRTALGDVRFCEDKELFAVEDYDFFLQLIDKGIRIKYLKEALTKYDMSGCSHGEKASERGLAVYEKWKHRLSDKEKREVEYFYYRRKADYYRITHQYGESISYYKQVMKSSIFEVKLIAVKGILLCLLKA